MIAYRTVRRVILAVDDPTERKVRFMALLNSSLPKGARDPYSLADQLLRCTSMAR